jgi:NitT/TauT family transport system substrate-binding protein
LPLADARTFPRALALEERARGGPKTRSPLEENCMAVLRRVTGVLALVAFGFLAADVPVRAADEPLTKLVVSWGTLEPTNTPLWVAVDAGIFKKHGLDVDLRFVASALQIPAMLSGAVQIAMVGGSEVAAADASGADFEMLAVLGPIATYIFEAVPSVKTLADMKGKSVAVSRFGDAPDAETRIAFRKLGLDPKDVTFVQVGTSSNRMTALLSGAVQGTPASPGLNLDLENHGMHPLFDMGKMNIPAANISIAARRSWIAANRPVVQRYVDAMLEAIQRTKTDRAYSVAILKRYFKTDDTKAMSASYDYINRVIPTVPYPKTEQFTDLLAEMANANEKLRTLDVAKILDDSFVRDAARRMKLK